jgi:hypothetical protein
VLALRATVRLLRAELDAVWEAAAAATAAARQASRWELTMPLVQAALSPTEVAETRTAVAAVPALAGVTSISLDLRPDTAMTEIVLTDAPKVVVADASAVAMTEAPNVAMADLPESALLDAKTDRDSDVIDVTEPATASAADTILPARRTA